LFAIAGHGVPARARRRWPIGDQAPQGGSPGRRRSGETLTS